MSQSVALYRKYRSRSLDDLVGQEHITETLKRAFEKQQISHAYLLTGPHGVGKTSTARIIAHVVNDITDSEGQGHLDIIEIDAASNRRIEEVRDLREKIHIAPSSLKYKVYIIDEVHMLTNEAFNALLKTLEEPPAHAIFILATTEVHKLPATIISRTQRFSFRPIAPGAMQEHLKHIADQESITIDSEALQVVAEHAQGSFRDAISLLDQISTSYDLDRKISAEDVRSLIGLASDKIVTSLTTLVLETADVDSLFKDIDQLYAYGASVQTIALQLAHSLRDRLSSLTRERQVQTLELTKDLLHLHLSSDPKLKLQTLLALFMLHSTAPPSTLSTTPNAVAGAGPKLDTATSNSKPRPKATSKVTKRDPEPTITATTNPNPVKVTPMQVMERWDDIMLSVKSEMPGIHAALRQAQVSTEEDQIVLHFQYPLHQRKVKQQRNFTLLSTAIEQTVGGVVAVDCRVAESEIKTSASTSEPAEADDQPGHPLEKLRGVLGGEIVQLSQ